MAIKSYRVPATGFCQLYHFANSQSNKLPNGKVNTLIQSTLDHQKAKNTVDRIGRYADQTVFHASDAQTALTIFPPSYASAKTRLLAEARARFDGNIRKGHADLGVTLGSWRQSWDMIAKRGRQAASSLDRAQRNLTESLNNSQRLKHHGRLRKRDRELRRWIGDNRGLETPAGLVLEGEFGWLPLIQDAAKAFGVMTKPCPNGWVTGRARTSLYDTQHLAGNPRVGREWSGYASCTIAANVWVDNPNLWLANQLGLLNAPGVAWDLVPWSFVVNMFTNLGQIANSFTSYYGLRMNNMSTTDSLHYLGEESVVWTGQGDKATAKSSNLCARKNRSIGGIPAVPFVFRMPELSFETALIAVSLAIQQVSRITKLLS